ncbi:MAG: PKD domain-containing protein [Cyclobacteriaceae bacterium]|jgi:hypothetical protein|nr:PKD domain-containing protein [Cyclobacteriaceae bacterium]
MHRSRVWWIVCGLACWLETWASPPVTYVANHGQWGHGFDFVARVQGQSLFIRAGETSYRWVDGKHEEELHHRLRHHDPEMRDLPPGFERIKHHHLRVQWVGANTQADAIPLTRKTSYGNYFVGDPATWRSRVPHYEGVLYRQVYPGIDVQWYAQGHYAKYDWMVAAGADPCRIVLDYSGADHLELQEGDLIVRTSLGTLIEKKPVAFQWMDGIRTPVACEFVVEGTLVSFTFPEGYDGCYPLVIDPLLIFSTYSGSTADNWGSTATPGERGTLYSSGITNHNNEGGVFPATPGAFEETYQGDYDVAILKYDSTGSQLLYASYLGGRSSESPHSLVVNATNELLILGTTSSDNFAVTPGAFDTSFNGGLQESNVFLYPNGSDLFVSKISADGTQLLASTYVGGSSNDGMNPPSSRLVANYGDELRGDIIPLATGSVLVSSVTASADFPVANGYDVTYNGGRTDAVILQLDDNLSRRDWATFIGGALEDASHTIKLHKTGDVLVGGGTASADFPTTPGSYQPAFSGNVDGWIMRLSGDGAAIRQSTFTGTAQFDQVYFIDVDSQGDVFAYGQTNGPFPITAGTYRNANSGQFLQKLSADLSTRVFSTVFGSGIGIPNLSPTAFLVNDCNNIYMAGWGGQINSQLGFWPSSTANMPITNDAFQRTTSGSDFYFIVLTADASQFLYGTYLGGTSSRTHVDGGTSRFDKSGIVYHAVCSGCNSFNPNGPSSDFPTTPNAWSRTNNSGNCNNAAFKFDLSSLRARLRTNSLSLDQPGLDRFCLPDPVVFENFSTGGQVYQWSFGDGGQRTTTRQDTVVYRYRTEGRFRVRLIAIDQGTCRVRDSATTFVNIFQRRGQAQPIATVCFGESSQLVASGGAQYQWQQIDGPFRSQQPINSVLLADTARFSVSIVDANGCLLTDTLQASVVPKIPLSFEVQRNYACDGRSAVQVRNTREEQGGSENIFFDFGDGTTTRGLTVTHRYEQDGTYPIQLVGIREFCRYDTTAVVAVASPMIPNVFTPEQTPGFNDAFMIQYGGRDIVQAEVAVSLLVVNRWGKKVFESADYRNDWTAANVAGGVYYYEARFPDDTRCKGWVHVMK